MERLKTHKFEKLLSGQAENVEDFFEKLIKPQFVHKEIIKKLHKTIMDYVNLKDATLFLRLYGSGKPYSGLRRGFLTEYPDKTKMVFCDNTFSMIFAGLKIGGYSISEKELADHLQQKDLICSYIETSEEKELSYYSNSKAIQIEFDKMGWYLAHIKPTGTGFGELSQKKMKEMFPNPDRSEWDNTRIRKASENLSDDHKQLLIAHFVRLVHPLNSFLVPLKSNMKYSGKNIGEEVELIKHVREYLKEEFPKEYEEFEKITLLHNFKENKTLLNNLKWFETKVPNKSKKHKRTTRKKQPSSKNPIKKDTGEKSDSQMEQWVKRIREIDDLVQTKKVSPKKSKIDLDKWLKSIGKATFVEILFPALRDNINVTYKEIAEKYPKYENYKSQQARLSTARSIFHNGLELKALQIIAGSSRLDANVVEKAKLYLKK